MQNPSFRFLLEGGGEEEGAANWTNAAGAIAIALIGMTMTTKAAAQPFNAADRPRSHCNGDGRFDGQRSRE